MIHYSDEAIIEGLRLKSDFIIRYIYQAHYPVIRYLVMNNSGKEEDAEDLFQDALMAVFKNIKESSLDLNCSFNTYLYSVGRNLWLQKLKERKNFRLHFDDVENYVDFSEHETEQLHIEEMEKLRLYQQHFLTLSSDCQKVLLLFMKKYSLKQIAEEMGYKTEKYAKTRKYLCKEELKKRIINDPKCHKFLSDD